MVSSTCSGSQRTRCSAPDASQGAGVPVMVCVTGSTLTSRSSALSLSPMATSPSASGGGGADDCLVFLGGGTTTVISSPSLLAFLPFIEDFSSVMSTSWLFRGTCSTGSLPLELGVFPGISCGGLCCGLQSKGSRKNKIKEGCPMTTSVISPGTRPSRSSSGLVV